MKINIGDTWKTVTATQINIGDSWKAAYTIGPFNGHATLTNDLVGYWSLDTNGTAESGGNTMIVTGATHTASGKISGAYVFDGVEDYISTTSNIGITGSTSRTHTMWYKTTQAASGCMVCYGSLGAVGYNFELWIHSTGAWVLACKGANRYWTPSADFNDGNWHFLALVLDGTDCSDLTLYLDNSAETVASTDDYTLNTAASTMRLGRRLVATTYDFAGTIDEVGVWDRALTSAELTALYNSGDGLAY